MKFYVRNIITIHYKLFCYEIVLSPKIVYVALVFASRERLIKV